VPTFCPSIDPSFVRSIATTTVANVANARTSSSNRRRTVAARNARRADANADANPRVRRSNVTLDDDVRTFALDVRAFHV